MSSWNDLDFEYSYGVKPLRGKVMKLYSLLDKKSGVYGAIMMGHNDAFICRMIEENCRPTDTVARFATDFDLFEVGEFDDSSGRVSKDEEVRFVCNMGVVFNGKEK